MESPVEDVLNQSKPSAKKAFLPVYALLVEESGCVASSRSGYVSFSLGVELVAAAHPNSATIELALAIPYVPADPNMIDAIDYKWRYLPSAVSISNADSARRALPYVREALERVSNGVKSEVAVESYARPPGAFDPAFKKGRGHRG